MTRVPISHLFRRAQHALRLDPRIFLHFPDQVQSPAPGLGRATWVLTRALCHYKSVDLSLAPQRTREHALQLHLTQFSPFSSTGHYAVWRDGCASVWYWDQAIVLHAMLKFGLNPQRVSVLPEGVLYSPNAQGLRLIKNLQGIEGQFWRNNQLVQSRWWQNAPDADEWLAFQRDLGLAGEDRHAQMPSVLDLPRYDTPQLVSAAGSQISGWLDERAAYALLFLALSIPTAWTGATLIKSTRALRATLTASAELERKATPMVIAREQALRALARCNTLHDLDPLPSQLELMARIASVLPKGATNIKEWDFHDGKLKIVIVKQNDTLSSTALVTALQVDGYFANIQVASGNDPKVLSVSMDIATEAVIHA